MRLNRFSVFLIPDKVKMSNIAVLFGSIGKAL